MSRDHAEITHELDYWKSILDDAETLNTLISETAANLAQIPALILRIVTGGDSTHEATISVSEISYSAMGQLHEMHEPLRGLLSLAEGRLTAIEREAGLHT